MTGVSPDAALPQTLGQAFATFEAIRQLARQYEGRSPELFAAFMSVAVTAADGRDAVLTASALPTHEPSAAGPGESAPDADPHEVADWIATSAVVLATRLALVTELAAAAQDRRACQDAAAAARHIHQLLATADDAHAR